MKPAIGSIENFIHSVRGEKVIFSGDLANIYGVSAKVLNQAIKRNRSRFPIDFCFQLNVTEWRKLRSQIVTSKYGSRYRPWVFTEHGAVMAANVLRSEKAIQMSIFVVRAFMKMRQALGESSALTARLDALEKEITSRLDSHEKAIVELMQQFLAIINPPEPDQSKEEPKREIGYHVKYKKEGTGVQSRQAR